MLPDRPEISTARDAHGRSPANPDDVRLEPAPRLADTLPMPDRSGRHIDVVSSEDGDFPAGETRRPWPLRRWVGIHFACCGVYARVYRNPDQPSYEGRCPRCRRTITMQVGPDGVNARIFLAEPV